MCSKLEQHPHFAKKKIAPVLSVLLVVQHAREYGSSIETSMPPMDVGPKRKGAREIRLLS
jgi:hypothetical protein